MTTETTLKVTEDNIESVPFAEIGEELPCEVFFIVHRADPDVGLRKDIEILQVKCMNVEVTNLFDERRLWEEILDKIVW